MGGRKREKESTLKLNVSLKTGLSVFLWTFVSNFFFLSGSKYTCKHVSFVHFVW